MLPVVAGAEPARARVSIDTRNADHGSRRHRRRRHDRQRRLGVAVDRWPPSGASPGSRCTCWATPGRCSSTRRTTTSSPRCGPSWSNGPRRRSPPASTRSGSIPASGSARRSAHNLALLARLDALVATGFPVCVGLSRKAFLGRLLAASDDAAARPDAARASAPGAPWTPSPRCRQATASRARSPPSCGPRVQGVAMVRVHDVRATVDAVDAGGRHDHEPHEGQVGARHRAPQLRLDHQGPPRHLRAARRLRREPPPGAPPGGDHLAARAGLRLRDLDDPVVRTTSTTTTSTAWPTGTGRSAPATTRGPTLERPLPRDLRAAGRRHEGGAARRRGGRPHRRRRRRLHPLGRHGARGPARHLDHRDDHRRASSTRSAAASSPWPASCRRRPD